MLRVLLLLDFLNVAYRAPHARRSADPVGPDGASLKVAAGVLSMTRRLIRRSRATHVAFAFDAPGETFRDALFPDYKAGRPGRPADLDAQLPLVREMIERLGYAIHESPGYEADDVIAAIVAQAEPHFDAILVASGDHDLLAVVSERTTLLDLSRGLSDLRAWTPAQVKEHYGVDPAHLADYKALVGDRGDGYAGCPEVADRSARALLERFGSLDAIYADLAAVRPRTLRQRLRDGEPQACLALELARLHADAPVGFERDGGAVRAVGRDVADAYLARVGLGGRRAA